MTTVATPATRDQIAMYGHVAARLREVCKARDWRPADLNAAVGRDRGHASAYQWLGGKAAPGPKMRAKVSKATGIAEADLMVMRKRRAPPPPSQAVALVEPPPARIVAKVGDVLSFVVSSTGEARIRLDVSLPVEAATPLLRMLLDAGLVFNAGGG